MNCYKHSHSSAVGLCKTCYKAVCYDCAADVGNCLACKDSCEEKVLELNEMWERSAKIYGVSKNKSRIPSTGVLLWLLLSVVMWVTVGIDYYATGHIADYVALIMAVVFTAALSLAIYSARRTGLKC
jgi:hypothetical protein